MSTSITAQPVKAIVLRGGAAGMIAGAVMAMFAMAMFAMVASVTYQHHAKITNSGSTISDMASMVGWATFIIEHMMFGLVLGAIALRAAAADRSTDVVVGARSAMLSR